MDLLSDYDFSLPDELIARQPADRRDQSRLLRLGRTSGELSHHIFHELPQLLRPGDLLVLNDSRVIRARLRGFRTATGGGWSGLFLNATGDGRWRLLGHTRGKLVAGETLSIARYHAPDSPERLELRLLEKEAGGIWQTQPVQDIDPLAALEMFGTVPLPPYMQREAPTENDLERYQTTYAQHPGSVAAPTAGLHLTTELRQTLTACGVEQVFVTLHVGLGTFLPMAGDSLDQHKMHFEWCDVGQEV